MDYVLERNVIAIRDIQERHVRSSRPVPGDPSRTRSSTDSDDTFVDSIPRVRSAAVTVLVHTAVVSVSVIGMVRHVTRVSSRRSSFFARTSPVRSVRSVSLAQGMALVWTLSVLVRINGTVVIVLKTRRRESVRTLARTKVFVWTTSARACRVGSTWTVPSVPRRS